MSSSVNQTQAHSADAALNDLTKEQREAVLRLYAWVSGKNLTDHGYGVSDDIWTVLSCFQLDVRRTAAVPRADNEVLDEMPNKIKALSGAIQALALAAEGISGDDVPGRDDYFRDEVAGQLVDTVCAFDTGSWETGIERDGTWFIVEQYDNRDAAQVGHEAWVGKLTANPVAQLREVEFDLL